ncbi:bifunctional methionine sulfoxide reductase B/A protein [Bdellovibrionota bacterium FG-1]
MLLNLVFIVLGVFNVMADNNTPAYKKPTATELRAKLTPQQYKCTQEEGTERPFENPFWDQHEDGIYVDVISGQPLFSSLDKFDSGTGWPSFTRPIESGAVQTKSDRKLGVERTEIRSSRADSHLGHVFDDGPLPTGKRFCMNSASLRFVPLAQMKDEGYGKYLFAFAEKEQWKTATLAGGCFWGMEDLLRQIPGVVETQAGYAGGDAAKSTYDEVKKGNTGNAESVQILFDPKRLSYEEILLRFFKMHDPTTSNRQGNDTGTQYRSAIFYADEEQKRVAETVKKRVEKSGKWGKPIVTQIVPAKSFVRAEDDHQKYLAHHPHGYTCHFIRKIKF